MTGGLGNVDRRSTQAFEPKEKAYKVSHPDGVYVRVGMTAPSPSFRIPSERQA